MSFSSLFSEEKRVVHEDCDKEKEETFIKTSQRSRKVRELV